MNSEAGRDCKTCHVWQPIDSFPIYDNGRGTIGRRGECYTCYRQRINRRRHENTENAPPPSIPSERWCPGCETLRPASDFQRDNRSSDGLQTRCKYCRHQYYEANMEREKARAFRHAEKDRTKSRERARAWVKANPERVRITQQTVRNRRRVRKKGNGGKHTRQEWEALCAQYGHRCLCCGRTEPEIRLTIDHVVPLSRGGRNDIANIQPLCLSCNSIKHNKIIDYRPRWNVNANRPRDCIRGLDNEKTHHR